MSVDTRLEDYLQDKLQTSADLETLDSCWTVSDNSKHSYEHNYNKQSRTRNKQMKQQDNMSTKSTTKAKYSSMSRVI